MTGRMLVLLIDSIRTDLEAAAAFLREEDFEVATAEDGPGGLREFFNVHPDVVVIDLGVREMSGWKVITRIRELSDTPLIVTSATATGEQVARAFEAGANGFLTKPFAPGELLTRVRAVLNQGQEPDEWRWVYRRNGLTVDLRSAEVFKHGEPVQLTSTEYRLLTYLIDRRGWVLSHDQILSHVWGADYIGDKNQVKLYVWYLRQKIENDPRNPQMIITKRGLGYTFAG